MKTRGEDFDWSFEMVLIWARYLTKKVITKAEFELAEEKSFDGDWMPNNAKEFLALARNSTVSNYPDIHQAYRDAANCNYSSHEVLYETARRVGFYDIRTKSESVTYKRWQAHYPVVCSEHEQGMVFTLPVGQQIEHKHTPVQAGSEADKRINERLAQLLKTNQHN